MMAGPDGEEKGTTLIREDVIYMLHLLLLLLVGTISAEKSGDCPQEDLDRSIVPDVKLNKCNMPEILDNTPVGDCPKETYHNVSLDLQCGSKHGNMCPGKATCHIRLFTSPMIFLFAQAYCRCYRGSLSSIHSSCVNNGVRAMAQSSCGNRYGWVWIGVYKPYNSCHYLNADGSRLDYTNWACGNPNRCGAWCTALNLSNGQWYSINCCYTLPFVCTF
ncbi:bone marrow proteoglycan-like [Hyla sarda]|uniref:bone marrow proteoglycan-like n=1 Tax=Hyla sarda TaxID=327740 RepID=UPI0024C3191B|nr:bone marrow proteoglycan-like [Hyla sarda]